jgi:strictosidine synthase-like protein
MSQVRQHPITFAVLLANVLTVAFPAYSADTLNSIEVPGERAYPESISAAPDGTLYVSSLASGGIARIKPGASKAERWIRPGAFDSRSTLGVARRRTFQSFVGLLERHVGGGSSGTKLLPRQLSERVRPRDRWG